MLNASTVVLVQKVVEVIHKVVGEEVVVGYKVGVRSRNGHPLRYQCSFRVIQETGQDTRSSLSKPQALEVCSNVSA